jgi:hypothetical protein
MDARQNFWLALHQLSNSIERQGAMPTNRTDAILDALNELSPTGRKEAVRQLTDVLVELQVLHSLVRTQQPQPMAATAAPGDWR